MSSTLAPAAILRSHNGGIYSLCFTSRRHLLSGNLSGEVCLWDLQDQRPVTAWKVSSQSVLSVQTLKGGCLSQSKDGRVKLWDLETQQLRWEVATDSCSFCRVLVEPQGGDDSSSGTPLLISPLSEPQEIGIFDPRLAVPSGTAPPAEQLLVSRLVLPRSEREAGMCTDLCRCPALGPGFLLATYESSDVALWDMRQPTQPVSYAQGDPSCPAICSAVLWRKVWISCAGGQLKMLRLNRDGSLQASSTSVQVADAPYKEQSNEANYQAEKLEARDQHNGSEARFAPRCRRPLGPSRRAF